jgi:hypothetical protein
MSLQTPLPADAGMSSPQRIGGYMPLPGLADVAGANGEVVRRKGSGRRYWSRLCGVGVEMCSACIVDIGHMFYQFRTGTIR